MILHYKTADSVGPAPAGAVPDLRLDACRTHCGAALCSFRIRLSVVRCRQKCGAGRNAGHRGDGRGFRVLASHFVAKLLGQFITGSEFDGLVELVDRPFHEAQVGILETGQQLKENLVFRKQ